MYPNSDISDMNKPVNHTLSYENRPLRPHHSRLVNFAGIIIGSILGTALLVFLLARGEGHGNGPHLLSLLFPLVRIVPQRTLENTFPLIFFGHWPVFGAWIDLLRWALRNRIKANQ